MENIIRLLSNSDAPSGNEEKLSNIITQEASKYCDEIYKDRIGNIYAYKYADSDKTIMLCSHYDEVGFIVSSITDDGYLKFKQWEELTKVFFLQKECVSARFWV